MNADTQFPQETPIYRDLTLIVGGQERREGSAGQLGTVSDMADDAIAESARIKTGGHRMAQQRRRCCNPRRVRNRMASITLIAVVGQA